MRGKLILVVGPSGVGKDSLIAGAKEEFADWSAISFARRHITRPLEYEPNAEIHEPISLSAFKARNQAGGYMLSWQAHNLSYGIPQKYDVALKSGISVVANVSRTILNVARKRFQPLLIIHVTADPKLLEQRLAKRGRETIPDQEERLRRAESFNVAGPDLRTIRNDGSLKETSEEFNRCLLCAMRSSQVAFVQ